MVDAVKLAASAERLIKENGRKLVFQKEREGSADPNKPWRGKAVGGPDTVTVTGVVLNYTNKEKKDSNLIRMGDKKILLSSKDAGIELDTFDTILDEGVQWKIVEISEVKPGTTSIIYRVHVRL